jgi:multicomponent Na+:H+ antiporter subunit E
MNLAMYLLGLVVIWVLAWGSLSVANVLSGLAVAGVMLWLAPDTFPGVRRPASVRVGAVVRFVAYVAAQVIVSNLALSRVVLARRSRIRTGVMAVPLPELSDGLLTLVVNVMALSPGTIPLQLTREPRVLYVHVLQMDDIEASRRQVERLVDLAWRAFGRLA